MRRCPKCKRERPESDYVPSSYRCTSCRRNYEQARYRRRKPWHLEYNKQYRARKKAEDPRWKANKPQTISETTRLNKYKDMGYERGDFERMLEQQGGKCAICGTEDPGANGFQLDHCHDRNKIRGLLCTRCNSGMGMLRDDSEILAAAIQYLRRWAKIHEAEQG